MMHKIISTGGVESDAVIVVNGRISGYVVSVVCQQKLITVRGAGGFPRQNPSACISVSNVERKLERK